MDFQEFNEKYKKGELSYAQATIILKEIKSKVYDKDKALFRTSTGDIIDLNAIRNELCKHKLPFDSYCKRYFTSIFI